MGNRNLKKRCKKILITSIALDGKMSGYNIELINIVLTRVKRSVIAGCGADAKVGAGI